jgi:predicted polyphosphate/ATP-dependent NAD kinase
MSVVGIIANPASGKDIRRLVARSSVFDNNEKVNIVRRVLLGLEALGVRQVVFMPDYYGLGEHALEHIKLALDVSFLDMDVHADDRDSTEAGRLFAEMNVGCIVTLGGDGTNRAVAKGCADVPLVPISTGTNNVVPSLVEGTIAGLAAGLIAEGDVDARRSTRRERASTSPWSTWWSPPICSSAAAPCGTRRASGRSSWRGPSRAASACRPSAASYD